MTDHLWTTLWAHEVEPQEIPVGAIATFVKAPRRDGEYGFVDALIAGLDRCPLTHAGIVDQVADGPELIHSTMAGLRREPLSTTVAPHRRGPLFLFHHAAASEATIRAVVDHATERVAHADPHHDAYPMGDLLLAAVLLQLRNGSRFDEHSHHRLAELFGTAVDPALTGRMCAAFVGDLFPGEGARLAGPDERTAFATGLVACYDRPVVPECSLDLVRDGLVAIAGLAADGAARAALADEALRAEVVDAFHQVATDPAVGRHLAAWVIAADPADEEVPRAVARLVDAVGRSSPDRPVGGGGSVRFSTVNDLVRSPDLVPFGHVIGWAHEPAAA